MGVFLSNAPAAALERYVRIHQAGIGQLSTARKPGIHSLEDRAERFIRSSWNVTLLHYLRPRYAPLPAFRSPVTLRTAYVDGITLVG